MGILQACDCWFRWFFLGIPVTLLRFLLLPLLLELLGGDFVYIDGSFPHIFLDQVN
jgi:hypothetical protein